MTQVWFLPLALLVGVVSSRTSLLARRANRKDRSWWWLWIVGWLPLACWALSQIVAQD